MAPIAKQDPQHCRPLRRGAGTNLEIKLDLLPNIWQLFFFLEVRGGGVYRQGVSYCIAITGLEIDVDQANLKFRFSAYLCLPSTRIKGMWYDTELQL